MERLLSATGKANLTMIPMLTGAVVNIVLDPVMIFGWFGLPALGIAGAAYATVIAQAVAALVGLFLNLKFNKDVRFTGAGYWPKGGSLLKYVKLGYPVGVAQLV